MALCTVLAAAMLVTIPALSSGGQLGVAMPGTGVGATAAAAAVAAEPEPEAQDVRIEQTTLGNIFQHGEAPRFDVRTDANQVSWSVRDYWGGRAASGEAEVAGGKLDLRVPLEHSGYFELSVSTGAGDTAEAAFALLPKADRSAPEPFTFGVQTFFNQGWPPELATLLKPIGVEATRDAVPWEQIEHTKGEYDFQAKNGRYEKYMNALRREGIEPLTNFGLVNEHYDNGATPHTDEGLRAYADYAAAVAEHYTDEVDSVGVGNEPNLPKFGDIGDGPADAKPESYAKQLRLTYQSLKEARPNLRVAGPEVAAAHQNIRIWEPWLDKLFELGALEHMDVVSVHPYRDRCCKPEGMTEDIEVLRDLLKRHDAADKPIWITEQGWSNALVSEEEQAGYVPRTYAEGMAAGVDRYYWFNFRDSGAKAYGLLRRKDHAMGGHTPKPSYVSYGVMTAELSGMKYHGQDETPNGIISRRFQGEQGTTRVLWTPEGTQNVELATDEPVRVTDLMGRTRELSPVAGKVSLTLSENPVYVDGSVQEVTKGSAYRIQSTDTAVSEPAAATLTLDNTDGKHDNAEFTVAGESYDLRAPDGEVATKDIEVPTGGQIGPRVMHAQVRAGDGSVGVVSSRIRILDDVELRVEPRIPDVSAGKGALAVQVTNNTRESSYDLGKLTWKAAGQNGSMPAGTGVAPDSTETVEVPLPEKVAFWKRSSYEVSLDVRGAGSQDASGPIGFDPVAPVGLKVDANISEVADHPSVDLAQHGSVERTDIGVPYQGPQDLSGNMWVTADQQNLYVAAKVRDDKHLQNGSGPTTWQGDGVQFALSAGMPGETTEFYEYVVALTQNGPQVRRTFAPEGERVGNTEDPLAVRRDEDAKTTYYEVAIPWESLQQLGPDEKVFSLSMLVNDNDGGGREGWIEWGSGIGREKDPSLYNPVVRP